MVLSENMHSDGSSNDSELSVHSDLGLIDKDGDSDSGEYRNGSGETSPPPLITETETAISKLSALKQLGSYIVGKKIGEGAFAIVKRGVHMITDESVALKLFYKPAIKEEYLKKNLYREGNILQKIYHPNVVKLLEIIETDTIYCLVMELCEVDVLTYLCSVGKRNEDQARKYGWQLIEAFQYLHSENIVHRDLKAENLMLNSGNILKIIDFGLSNDMTGKDFLDTQCGSMSYSAPELLSHKPYGKAVDVWSIGVCLYVLLTGRLPFGNMATLTELHALMLDGTYTLPDAMSEPLKDLFGKIFHIKPNKRIKLQELKEHEWFQSMKEETNGKQEALSQVTKESDMNDKVLEEMNALGFTNRQSIIESVLLRKCDRSYATYHLLVARNHRLALEEEIKKEELRKEQLIRERSARTRSNSKGSINGKRASSFSSTSGSTVKTRQRLRRMSSNEGETRNRSRTLSKAGSAGRLTPMVPDSVVRPVSPQSHATSESLNTRYDPRVSQSVRTVDMNAVKNKLGRLSVKDDSNRQAKTHNRRSLPAEHNMNELVNYAATLAEIEVCTVELNEGATSVYDKLCILTEKALCLAPDQVLQQIVIDYGWDGQRYSPRVNFVELGDAFRGLLSQIGFLHRKNSTGRRLSRRAVSENNVSRTMKPHDKVSVAELPEPRTRARSDAGRLRARRKSIQVDNTTDFSTLPTLPSISPDLNPDSLEKSHNGRSRSISIEIYCAVSLETFYWGVLTIILLYITCLNSNT
eukprot:m.61597 g.61597  ORF g.61597 m.61597 type:complete len:753 (-) comp11427_c0_seq2:33-2291(-)